MLAEACSRARVGNRLNWFLVMMASAIVLLATGVKAGPISDDDISAAVSQALMNDDGVSGNLIDVHTVDGVVNLTGSTDNLLAKERAAKVAETIKGVRSVINRVDVKAIPRTDGQISKDVEAALAVDPVTESSNLHVAVDKGDVTLTGKVDSWQRKQFASRIAKGVIGVKAVRNDIDIHYVKKESDSEIKNDVTSRLSWDALVDNALLETKVKDGNVTLSGIVGSAAEKSRAVNDAWTMGVKSVNADGVTVEGWDRADRFRTGKYVDKSNSEVTSAVRDALIFDPRVNSLTVVPSAVDGVVTLRGAVNDLRGKDAAAQDARNTVGVWRVKNQLLVRPKTTSDSVLLARVSAALQRNVYVDRYSISVLVLNGTVVLDGTVDSYFEKTQAEDAAAGVSGVLAVDNNLDVLDTMNPLTYDPYIDDFAHANYLDYDWYVYPKSHAVMFSDWDLYEKIEEQLLESPFVDRDEIHLSVKNGIATLKGTVDTWEEREEAQEKAYDAGALVVENDLKVVYGPDYYQP